MGVLTVATHLDIFNHFIKYFIAHLGSCRKCFKSLHEFFLKTPLESTSLIPVLAHKSIEDLIQVKVVDRGALDRDGLDQLGHLVFPLLDVAARPPDERYDAPRVASLRRRLYVCVAFFGLHELVLVRVEESVGVKEELLAEEVVLWALSVVV